MITVHSERNHVILNDLTLLLNLVERGTLTQLTAGSYIGSFGKKLKSLTNK